MGGKCLNSRPLDANCNALYGALLARLSTTRALYARSLTVLGSYCGVKLSNLANTTDTHRRIPCWEEPATVLVSLPFGSGRLVDVDVFFGFRGDIDRSIQMHLLARSTKDDQVELYTELAASYYVRKRTESKTARQRGDEMVKTCLGSKAMDAINEVSQGTVDASRQNQRGAVRIVETVDQETDPSVSQSNRRIITSCLSYHLRQTNRPRHRTASADVTTE